MTCTCHRGFTTTGHGTELTLTTVVADPFCPVHGETSEGEGDE